MNDMQKPLSGSTQLDTLLAIQENRRKVRDLRLKQLKRSGARADLPPVRIVNALPDIDDGQTNTLHLDVVNSNKVTVELSEWEDMDATYGVFFRVTGEATWGAEHLVDLGFDKAEFEVDLGQSVYNHGVHTVEYYVKSYTDANEKTGEPAPFFIDLWDPNREQQPDKPILPQDLVGGIITPDYLEDNGGVTFTLPTPLDSKVEDTYSFFVNGVKIVADQPAQAPYEVMIPTAFFDTLLEGEYEVTYTLEDRAGNSTDESFSERVRLVKTPTPELQDPFIPEGPAISLDEARDGVWVECNYEPRKPGDIVSVFWEGESVDSAIYPEFSVLVPFAIVSKPGVEYTATVKYELTQDRIIYPSGDVQVTVDLEEVGPPNPEGPDNIINPDLELLELESFTQQKNAIVPADKGQPATITVPLYDSAKEGDMIAVYYGDLGGMVGNPIGLTAQNVTEGEVSVPLLWPQILDKGNGSIPAFYRIYPEDKPENSQQSLNTTIVVTVNNMVGLPVATFPDADPDIHVINCSDEPWIRGVNVHLAYPDFVVGDTVIVHWVLHEEYADIGELPSDAPVEETRKDFPDTVDVADVAAGYIVVNVPWGIWLSALRRGTIVVSWTLSRDENTSGTSDPSAVRYSRIRGGIYTCPDDD